MTSRFQASTLGEIVARDFRAASVFDRYGLDFCCGGKATLDEACRAKGVDEAAVLAALQPLVGTEPADDGQPGAAWEPGRLIDHIVSRHHAYIRDMQPRIEEHLVRLINAHGARHPELARIADRFSTVGRDLQMHMMKEEELLFPYIRGLADAAADGRPAPPNVFGTIRNPIRMMELEHRDAGDELALINELTSGYTVPPDGCTTYRVCFEELAAFEHDLHEHVHLENNILFPRAAALEEEMSQAPFERPCM